MCKNLLDKKSQKSRRQDNTSIVTVISCYYLLRERKFDLKEKILQKIFLITTTHHHDKKKLLCGFNNIYHHCHATYCIIKIISNTNKEIFKEFCLLEFNKCNSLFLINKS